MEYYGKSMFEPMYIFSNNKHIRNDFLFFRSFRGPFSLFQSKMVHIQKLQKNNPHHLSHICFKWCTFKGRLVFYSSIRTETSPVVRVSI